MLKDVSENGTNKFCGDFLWGLFFQDCLCPELHEGPLDILGGGEGSVERLGFQC